MRAALDEASSNASSRGVMLPASHRRCANSAEFSATVAVACRSSATCCAPTVGVPSRSHFCFKGEEIGTDALLRTRKIVARQPRPCRLQEQASEIQRNTARDLASTAIIGFEVDVTDARIGHTARLEHVGLCNAEIRVRFVDPRAAQERQLDRGTGSERLLQEARDPCANLLGLRRSTRPRRHFSATRFERLVNLAGSPVGQSARTAGNQDRGHRQ
jgi:hypothetical protein